MKRPSIGCNDLVYSYKEQWFTGFAPCFTDGIYSLACCKGGYKTGGMRGSVSNNFDSKHKRNIWILSIAGNGINRKDKNGEHNLSLIDYKPGDAICLAKVDKVITLEVYEKEIGNRIDAIYKLENGEIKWQSNLSAHGNNEHNGEKTDHFKRTDCALGYKRWEPSDIYRKFPQILISEEYYIFQAGNAISSKFPTLDVNRGFCFNDKGESRTEALNAFISEIKEFAYTSGEDPFKGVSRNAKGGCSK